MSVLVFSILMSVSMIVNAADVKASIAAERNKISTLANKKDLTIKEWTTHVEVVDAKCDVEKDPALKKAYCEFYYEIYKASELFTDFPNGPGRDDCERYLLTAENMAKTKALANDLKKIVGQLCK